MKECPACAEQVQDAAKVCRFCSYDFKRKQIPTDVTHQNGCLVGCLAAAGIGVLLLSLSTIFGNTHSDKPAATPASPARELGSTTAQLAGHAIRDSLRNPDSLVIEAAWATVDGKIVCINYRAQNGFGGMNREFVAYENFQPHTGAKFWSKKCHGNMIDVTAAVKVGAGLSLL